VVTAPDLKIFFHNHCFDGAVSAALFADFYRYYRNPAATIAFEGMSHRGGDPFSAVSINGEENACVDFRYCADKRMNWWFDHHLSGFQPPELREHFEAEGSRFKFYDAEARSCALFMSERLKEQFGYEPQDPQGHWNALVTWADRIDGAVFESADEIVALEAPALRVMTWLRGTRDTKAIVRLIEQLGKSSLAELEDQPWVRKNLDRLLSAHQKHIELVRQRLAFDGCVAHYDLSGDGVKAHSSFIVYMLCPESTYSISLTRVSDIANISIGRNPWAANPGQANIARLCERYGGGGHPHVGGIAVPAGDMSRPREIVRELREALSA
jgi:hypothetical protein